MKNGLSLCIALLALALAWPAVAAAPAGQGTATADAKCLKCHSKNLKKKLGDGQKLSLRISAEAFGASVHGSVGCTGCHADVAARKHPGKKRAIANRRDYAIEQNQGCRQCHAAMYEAWSGSIHASLVAAGDPDAPLCSDCHGAHSVQPRAAYDPVSGEPCSNCHQEIYAAYSRSVHGRARAEGNMIRPPHVQAPICADCHRAHDVSAVAATGYLKDTCLGCHDGAAAAHAEWLPNAELHLQAVSCPACHSPEAERRVDLQLYDELRRAPVKSTSSGPPAEVGGSSLTPAELWDLVRQDSREGRAVDVTLRGRMEVTTGTDAHRLAASGKAIRSCESCHGNGAVPFRSVTVSISDPSGRKQRIAADNEVLNSVVSVGSVNDFYAPGGTRIKLLDYLLVLAVAGGLAIPAAHMLIGRVLARRTRGNEHDDCNS